MTSGGALAALGPILHVIIRPSPDAARSSDTPAGERVAMVIDTGSACSMVDNRTARALGHEPAYFTLIGGATGDPELRPVYRMEMVVRLLDWAGRSHDVGFRQEIVGLEPRPQRGAAFGLIGRDYLANMHFLYDGRRGSFTLLFDQDPAT